MAREQRMFGLWPSPITPAALGAALRLNEPAWDTDGRTLAWSEGRSDRGVVAARKDGESATRDLTPEISVRAFVAYGGGDFTLAHGACYFVGQADQRIYRQDLAGGPARPITPPFGAAASPAVSPDGRWVAYVHTFEDVDCIAVVDSEGRQWPRRLAEGRDFYMQPAWHPAGDRLAWVEWDHPNMPWDGTELRLAALDCSGPLPRIASSGVVAGGPDVSIFQPAFTRDGAGLLYISDETGWGHLCRRDLASGAVRQLTAGEAEHGAPAWMHGMRTFAELPSGRIAVIRSIAGFHRLVLLDPAGSERDLAPHHPGYTSFSAPAASPAAERLAVVASGGQQPPRVLDIDLADPGAPRIDVVRRSDSELVPPSALSAPQPVSWTSFDGGEAHGLYYPPASDRFEGRGAPPLVVLVHGGPTSQVTAAWNPQAQFFATRGYAVLLPNYRGSTGYGRAYMLALRQSWGIYDVEDARTGALALADRGLADPGRLVIMGGSAGGFTVLQSLVQHPGVYKAAICMFGVANQFTLASDTHKFEARYLDSLLGPLPEAAAVYRERSPIFHADRIRDPIAVFQGEIDRVVPREQSDSIVASLRARGVPHEYHVYPGEGHGWRKSETIDHFYKAVEAFLRTHVLYA
ncbi:prolyl oligopeptidase family serine peptidase [Tepidiforma flava]|uniref:Prolyl oligopeptidase family serine peptidase n=1 Tax=Tepidiforma flava TaxID=3004094 RepID=A0ABY7MAI0_9CHLR|nr:prolyl oligopeptidase family serine peptidase [Tepidiforma flava]WBL36686.1 prolyl oligopeptidase family serine peptidase [Tepidiforma flava]